MASASAAIGRGVAKGVVALALAVAMAGCGGAERAPAPPADEPWALDVDVRSDTGADTLRIEPPSARVWVASVSADQPPASIGLSSPEALDAPLPDALPAAPGGWPAPPALAVDEGLKPPVLKRSAPLEVPADRPARPTVVEVDVLVGADGLVVEVAWAGGEADPSLMDAALACARAMEFYPALRGGTPVAVWCRQRFDFAAR